MELIKAIIFKELAFFNIPITASVAVGEGELVVVVNGWKVVVLSVGENKFLWIFYCYTGREYNILIIIFVIQNWLYHIETSLSKS